MWRNGVGKESTASSYATAFDVYLRFINRQTSKTSGQADTDNRRAVHSQIHAGRIILVERQRRGPWRKLARGWWGEQVLERRHADLALRPGDV